MLMGGGGPTIIDGGLWMGGEGYLSLIGDYRWEGKGPSIIDWGLYMGGGRLSIFD